MEDIETTAETTVNETPDTAEDTEQEQDETPDTSEDIEQLQDEQLDKMYEIASLVSEQVAEDNALSQQQYETIINHMESVSYCCTVIIGVNFSILLCVGITAGSILAKSIFDRFK